MCMIVMFLSGGEYSEVKGKNALQWADLVPMQTEFMQICVIIAFLCVPLMLCVKPIYYSMGHKKVTDEYQYMEEPGAGGDDQ